MLRGRSLEKKGKKRSLQRSLLVNATEQAQRTQRTTTNPPKLSYDNPLFSVLSAKRILKYSQERRLIQVLSLSCTPVHLRTIGSKPLSLTPLTNVPWGQAKPLVRFRAGHGIKRAQSVAAPHCFLTLALFEASMHQGFERVITDER
ncbi:hypothetical protein D6783_00840 [Candidatus Woesearchaeota archaeon]|nr:MAG: hypothetical protein D6783_00840 [Candidatus Woesearchaeota archaeon]